MLIKLIAVIFLGLPVLLLILHTGVRIIRHFYKYPMPEFAANLIDNPLRRKIQPPDEMARRHGIKPGMQVLEVGPGNGTYTLAAARAVGRSGRVATVDIEPRMIARVEHKMELAGVDQVDARVADVFDLPYQEGSFDVVYLIAVIGEIPDPGRAIAEFHRVLKPDGLLAFSEILMDPDYPLAGTLKKIVEPAGFQPVSQSGNFFSYTLLFRKQREIW